MPIIEDRNFNRYHRRPEEVSDVDNVEDQETNIEQIFPDNIFRSSKIDTLEVNKLVTGTISSQQITLGVTAGDGDVYIAGGSFDAAAWTCTGGFILGLDDSDSDASKFFIGDATTSLDWNVTTADTLTVKGAITATSGTIGGWVISATALKDVAGTVGMSSAVTGGDDVRFFAGHATPTSAPFRVTESGALVASSITATGTINATGGYVGAGSTALGIESAGFNIGTTGHIRGGQTAYDTGTGFFLGYSTDAYKFSIANGQYKMLYDGTTLEAFGNISPLREYVAGEVLAIRDAVFLEDGIQALTWASQTTDDDTLTFGNDATGPGQLAQSFQVAVSHTISRIIVKIGKAGSPIDNIDLTIEADDGGDPSGVPLASASIVGADLVVSPGQEETFDLDSNIDLVAATTYWIRLARSGADSGTNLYFWRYNTSGGYADGKFVRYDSGSWGDVGGGADDADFQVQLVTVVGKIYKASAVGASTSDGFLGFTVAAYSGAATAVIQIGDIQKTFSGLTVGSLYYLSDTYGAISTSAGSVTKKVGRALSATDLQIKYSI